MRQSHARKLHPFAINQNHSLQLFEFGIKGLTDHTFGGTHNEWFDQMCVLRSDDMDPMIHGGFGCCIKESLGVKMYGKRLVVTEEYGVV